jgi:spore photoproduct lyase
MQLQPVPEDITFELITHRFTAKAKTVIIQAYPESTLPMDEQNRQFRWGQFGYGKYLYPKEVMHALRSFLQDEITRVFPHAKIDYFV